MTGYGTCDVAGGSIIGINILHQDYGRLCCISTRQPVIAGHYDAALRSRHPPEFAAFFDNELRKFQRTAGLKAMD